MTVSSRPTTVNLHTELEKSKNVILKALIEALDSHQHTYVDCQEPEDACLDGWFNLVEIAERIAKELQP